MRQNRIWQRAILAAISVIACGCASTYQRVAVPGGATSSSARSLADVSAGRHIRITTRYGKHLEGRDVSSRDSLVLAVGSGIAVAEHSLAFGEIARAEVYRGPSAGQAVFATLFVTAGALLVLFSVAPPFDGG